MKPYRLSMKFYYNDEIQEQYSYILLLDEPKENLSISGTTFDELWNLNDITPIKVKMFKSDEKKGRTIHLYNLYNMITSIKEWKNNCKPFEYEFICEETEISMKQLMDFKVEDVVKYLTECGITSIQIVK